MSGETVAADTAYCRDCGAEIDARAEICPECGIRQRPPKQTASASRAKEKDPGIAAVASFFIPGLGQVYNGQIGIGLISAVVVLGLALTGIGLILAVPLWIGLVYDAYKTADKMNEPDMDGSQARASDLTEQQPVIQAVEWKGNQDNPGFAKDVAKALRKRSLSSLSPRKLRFTIEAIEEYQEFGAEELDLEDARLQVIAAWEAETGADWETMRSAHD